MLHSIRIQFLLLITLMPISSAMGQEKEFPKESRAKLLKVFVDEFVQITPGKGKFPKSFLMGSATDPSARPVRKVTFNYHFSVAKYEVPQNLWLAVMGANPSRWKGHRNSVEELTFHDAQSFCTKVTKLLHNKKLIPADSVVRLPTEAEWEYFARAGTKTRFSFGDDDNDLDDYAWHTGNAAGNDPPVGAKKPNAWGLYDIHGYLWEWCIDQYQSGYAEAPVDGSAAIVEGKKDVTRVARGGSWKDQANKLTSAYRQPLAAKTTDDAVGLRCVLAKRPAKK